MSAAPSKILIVDDEPEIRSMLNIFLSYDDFEIIEADSGKCALRQIIAEKPDAIILDLGLPDMDGIEVLIALRQFTQVPVIVLTARSDEAQIVKALSLGANDYVTKPFRAEILLARINANLRSRAPRQVEVLNLGNGPIQIDLVRHEVYLEGQCVPLTPKEFSLLALFMTNMGRTLTYKQILRGVWGPEHADDTQYLRVYISQLRKKLETVPGLSKAIVSESRIGYRMVPLSVAPTHEQPFAVAAE